MTEQDNIELSRWFAQDAGRVENNINDIDWALDNLVLACLSGEGLRALRQQHDRLADIAERIKGLLNKAPRIQEAAE